MRSVFTVLSYFYLSYHGKHFISSIFIHYGRKRFQDGGRTSFVQCLRVTTLTDLKRWIVIELGFINLIEYGIYKPQEVVHPKKKLVRKRTRLFIGCSTSLGL